MTNIIQKNHTLFLCIKHMLIDVITSSTHSKYSTNPTDTIDECYFSRLTIGPISGFSVGNWRWSNNWSWKCKFSAYHSVKYDYISHFTEYYEYHIFNTTWMQTKTAKLALLHYLRSKFLLHWHNLRTQNSFLGAFLRRVCCRRVWILDI